MSEFAGTLNERIEIWRRSTDRLANGASSEEWRLLISCRAAVTAQGAGVATEAMSVSSMPRYGVTIRPRPEIAVDQQIRWRGRRLVIRQVIDDPKLPDRMYLHCEEQR